MAVAIRSLVQRSRSVNGFLRNSVGMGTRVGHLVHVCDYSRVEDGSWCLQEG